MFKRKQKIIMSLVLMAALCFGWNSNQTVQAAEKGVTFYGDCYYSGPNATLGVGSYTLTQLADAGISNDNISSIKVPSGYVVVVYEHDYFSGKSWTFNSNASNFYDYGCNDAMSSVIIAKSGVTFYKDANYSNTSVTLGVGSYTLEQLAAEGIGNDDISSIKIPSGYVVKIYQHGCFGGNCWTFDSNTSFLGDYGCNDVMSSVLISKIDPVGVTFYRDVNYGSSAVSLKVGSYTMAQLEAAGIVNDDISSVVVPNGYSVRIYQDDNFGGNYWTFESNVSNFFDYNLNDMMSSVVISYK